MVDIIKDTRLRVLDTMYCARWTVDIAVRGILDQRFGRQLVSGIEQEARHTGRVSLWERIAMNLISDSVWDSNRRLNAAIADFKKGQK